VEWAGPVTRPQTVGEIVEIGGREIRFRDATRADRGYWAELTGVTTNDFVFVHDASGLAMRVTGDWTPSKVVFYAIGKAVCIEPFRELRLAPSDAAHWMTHYRLCRRRDTTTGRRP
jgi:hypothetical protein